MMYWSSSTNKPSIRFCISTQLQKGCINGALVKARQPNLEPKFTNLISFKICQGGPRLKFKKNLISQRTFSLRSFRHFSPSLIKNFKEEKNQLETLFHQTLIALKKEINSPRFQLLSLPMTICTVTYSFFRIMILLENRFSSTK